MTTDNTLETKDELATLKERADLMGLSYHPSIGVDKLRDKVNEAVNPVVEVVEPVVETKGQIRKRLQKEASKLVRIRISCLNPNKREWEGEIFTVSNAAVGTFRKYVHFDTEWHVPNIIFEQLKERKFQQFYTAKGPRGEKTRRGKLVNEFAIEVLPPLTDDELKELAQQQALAGEIDN